MLKRNRGTVSFIEESTDCIRLGNDRLELGFCRESFGALASIFDKQTGTQLLRDGDARKLLWRLALRRREDNEIEWIESSEAGEFRWSQEEEDDAVTVSLISSGFDRAELEVTVRVTVRSDSPLSVWRMEVTGLDESVALYQLTCPIISGLVKMGDPAPGEALAVPIQGEGYLFTNPFPVRDGLPLCSGPGPEAADVGVGRVGGRYPGAIPMQICAFYNNAAGLYFAAHDSGQNVKELQMGPFAEWGQIPVLSMSHFPGEMPGEDRAISYDTIVGVFHGDWHDAADIYKSWATKQWWCEKKLWDRDIAEWIRKGIGGVFQMSNYHIPKLDLNHAVEQIAGVVNELSDEAGVPLVGLLFNWEGGGAWTGPKGFFPPREGREKFMQAMARLREAGNHGFVYITGGCWYLKINYDPPFDSWSRFEEEGRPHAIKQLDGDIPVGRWYPGWESTRLCPSSDYARELTTSIVLECLDLGCTVVQIDNFPCGAAETCYDASHGHVPGFGPWWSEAWSDTLAHTRKQAKAKSPDTVIATEGISENFIPWLDLYDHRAGNMEYFGHYGRGRPMGGETIPLFNYVYNEYIGSYCAAYPECNRPEVLYWTRCLGKALAQGVIPTGGRYFPEPADHNPTTIGFYKKVVRATANECWPYLMFGEMLRPPEIEVPTITAQYCKFLYSDDPMDHRMDPKQRHEVQDRSVQHAVFRGRDGAIGYIFANISEDSVSFEVVLSAYGMDAERFDIVRHTDGEKEGWHKGIGLPRHVSIEMAPLSVMVVEVSRADDSSN